MDSIIVTGNGPLSGQIPIAGAKNACLTLMPATLLSEEPLTLTNAPRLSDIKTMTTLLQSLGAEVSQLQDGQVIAMSSHDLDNHTAHYDIVRKMRASNLVLGPMLARMGEATVSLPGGCAIGNRPIDLHLKVLEAFGAHIELAQGYVKASAPDGGLPGGEFDFPVVSVGATDAPRRWPVTTASPASPSAPQKRASDGRQAGAATRQLENNSNPVAASRPSNAFINGSPPTVTMRIKAGHCHNA